MRFINRYTWSDSIGEYSLSSLRESLLRTVGDSGLLDKMAMARRTPLPWYAARRIQNENCISNYDGLDLLYFHFPLANLLLACSLLLGKAIA